MCAGTAGQLWDSRISLCPPRTSCPAIYCENSKTAPDGKNCGSSSRHSVYSSTKIIKTNSRWPAYRFWGEYPRNERIIDRENEPSIMRGICLSHIDIQLDRPASRTQCKRNLYSSCHLKITSTSSALKANTHTIGGWKCCAAQRKRKILKISTVMCECVTEDRREPPSNAIEMFFFIVLNLVDWTT